MKFGVQNENLGDSSLSAWPPRSAGTAPAWGWQKLLDQAAVDMIRVNASSTCRLVLTWDPTSPQTLAPSPMAAPTKRMAFPMAGAVELRPKAWPFRNAVNTARIAKWWYGSRNQCGAVVVRGDTKVAYWGLGKSKGEAQSVAIKECARTMPAMWGSRLPMLQVNGRKPRFSDGPMLGDCVSVKLVN